MTRVDQPAAPPISVWSQDGWCATRKKTDSYADSIKTVCNMYVTLPGGIERRWPDCSDCCRILGIGEDDG